MVSKNYDSLRKLDNPKDFIELNGKVGLIAGGYGKMGLHFADFLCKAGATVIIADINPDVEKVSSDKNRKNLIGFNSNLSDESHVNELFEKISKRFGNLDFLISNIMSKPDNYYEDFENYKLETWNEVFSGNVAASFMLCQQASKLMKDSGGSIILTSSIYGLVGPDYRIYENLENQNPYDSDRPLTLPHSYSASKGALLSLCKSLSTELSRFQIRVNTLIPGGVYDEQSSDFHEKYVSRTPLGRMATWTDFNGAVLFLVSDFSRYMTGTSIIVDGGWTAW